MPNYCNNTVQIKGPAKKIQAIKKAIEEDKFLNYLYPMPQELEGTTADGSKNEELIKKTGASDWYDWRTSNWGTKWEVTRDYSDPEITKWTKGQEMLNWSFDSAWAPPVGAYEHFLGLKGNEDVSIFATYYEPGCDFAGVWEDYDDRGFTVSDYDSEDDFWTTEDGQLLDDNYGIVESKAEWEADQEAEKEDVTEYVKGNARNLDKLHIGEDA